MSSPLSVAVSGSDADPPEQHDSRAVPAPETGPAPAAGRESPAPAERHSEKPVSSLAVSATRSESSAQAETRPGVKSAIWSKIVENLVPAVLCGVVVGMFGFVLSSTSIRIDESNDKIDKLEVRMNDKIDKLEVRMNDKIDEEINDLEVKMNNKINNLDAKVEDLDDKVDDLDDKVDEISLKLTALIAALNKTDDVDAAVSGIVVPADP